jgi:hypothetical protein
MRYTLILMILLSFIACKNDSEKKNLEKPDLDQTEATMDHETWADSTIVSEKNIDLQQIKSIEIKRKELYEKEDEKIELEKLLVSKSFFKDADLYVLDFKYPFLNENIKPSYANFNEYISKSYLDIKGVEAQILEDKELYCDPIRVNKNRERRKVDYKIYNVNEKLISVLFYKENYYSGAMHPSYTFDCLNFDLTRAVFMNYEDFFIEGSEEELRKILNELLTKKIASGELYYDCWEISQDDFFDYKNNFVLDDASVEFFFDDCVICPSYTGTYSIKIPLEMLMPVLRKYKLNPLLG